MNCDRPDRGPREILSMGPRVRRDATGHIIAVVKSSPKQSALGSLEVLKPGQATRRKDREEDQRGDGWKISGTTCRRENCQGRTHKTGLNGGVS